MGPRAAPGVPNGGPQKALREAQWASLSLSLSLSLCLSLPLSFSHFPFFLFEPAGRGRQLQARGAGVVPRRGTMQGRARGGVAQMSPAECLAL